MLKVLGKGTFGKVRIYYPSREGWEESHYYVPASIGYCFLCQIPP